MKKIDMNKFASNIPRSSEIRELIAEFITEEAFVQFSCDFGFTPLNGFRFAFEDPEQPIQPLVNHLRKNGISFLCIEETPLQKYPLFPFTKWHDFTLMAHSSEN